jgi:2'-5' RNA ligase
MLDPNTEHATQLVNHWYWRPGHRPGRPFYTWHLTFENQHDLHRLVTEYHNILQQFPFLDLVPIPWLHMTMQGVGFVDTVTDHDLHTLLDAVRVRTAHLTTLPLQFHQLTARPQALALHPNTADAVTAVRHAIRRGIADAWGTEQVPEPPDGYAYQPHISVAYANTQHSTTTLRAALADHHPAPATTKVEHLSLIMIQRDNHQYRWQVAHSLPLL